MNVALFEPLKMIGGMGAAGNLALNDGGMKAGGTPKADRAFIRLVSAHAGHLERGLRYFILAHPPPQFTNKR